MIYTEFVMIILGISLVLYLILGGADFGAGILELFIGDKGKKTITKAIAPVWEANHMWLVIAVVILFNGFPDAYRIMSTHLHIPVLMFLIGIVFRGAAFTFRHYDAYKDASQNLYSTIFRYSSLFTVFFLGVTVASFIGGTMPPNVQGTFYDAYIAPWFNLFSFSVGLFISALSTYIAAIFILGEVETDVGYSLISKFSRRLFVVSAIFGLAIFGSSFFLDLSFHNSFLDHPMSLILVGVATALVPFIFKLIRDKKTWSLRLAVGFQILLIMMGWFIIQWPNLITFSDGSTLSMYDASGPILTMKVLFLALGFGVLIIFPALYYLFRIFKLPNETD